DRLIRPLVDVVLEAATVIYREAVVDLPRIAEPAPRVVDVVDRGHRRVVDVDLTHRAGLVTIEDIERLVLDEVAAVALLVEAELEVVASFPALLEVRQRGIELRLVALLILIRVVAAAVEALVVGQVEAAGTERFIVDGGFLRGTQGEEVAPVAVEHIEEHRAVEDARPFNLRRIVLRGL